MKFAAENTSRYQFAPAAGNGQKRTFTSLPIHRPRSAGSFRRGSRGSTLFAEPKVVSRKSSRGSPLLSKVKVISRKSFRGNASFYQFWADGSIFPIPFAQMTVFWRASEAGNGQERPSAGRTQVSVKPVQCYLCNVVSRRAMTLNLRNK